VSQEDFVRPITTSFPSLRDTLAHLVGAEWLWLERWKQRHPTALPAASEFPRLALLEKHWRAVAESVQKGTLRIVRSPSRTPPRASRRSR
jgi:uncharacterized damage-inducible protein DinB